MNVVNYNIISLEFDYLDITPERNLYLTDVIYQVIEDRDVYLFECNSADDTFIDELSLHYDFQKDCHKNKFMYTTKPIKLTKEVVLSMVEDRLFYLGHFAIVLSDLSDERNVSTLVTSWKDEKVLSGIQMIRMDYDGLYLFFYNMSNNVRLQKLLDSKK